jgi:hypothetical protein
MNSSSSSSPHTATEYAPREGGHSPWGSIQQVKERAPGAWEVSTASHGGFKLSAAENRKIPEPLRQKGGWYEEDCLYAVVYLFHEGVKATLNAAQIQMADTSLRNYYPDQYTAATGKPVALNESRLLQSRDHHARHANDWVTISAVGDWREGIPKGMVGVTACLGGRHFHTGSVAGECRAFLVPAEEYGNRLGVGFVIDPDRHPRVATDTYLPITKEVT